jgi:hypothetical protein
MPITAQSSDGVLHQFPDGTSGAVIDRAMMDYAKRPPKENGGYLKNAAAGPLSVLTSLPDVVMNALPGVGQARQLGGMLGTVLSKGKDPAGAYKALLDTDTAPVSHMLNSALPDSVNPEKVTQNTFGEKLVRGVTAGATGALIPGGEGYTVGNMLRNAVLGMTSGGGAVAGGEGAAALVPERFKPAARAVGSVVGGVAGPVAAVGAVNAVRGAGNYIRDAATGFTHAGPEQTVGKVLAEAAGGKLPAAAEAPLPGMKPTTGQATGNQGLLYLERSAEQATPEGARLSAESRTASNSAIMDAVQKIGDVNAPAAENMLDSLESARNASRKVTQTMWKQAGIEDTTPLQVAPLKADIGEFMSGLTRSGKSKVPANIAKVFEDFGETEPLREIQDWRSDISTALRAARKDGDVNGMRILGGLSDKIDDFLDNGLTHRPDNFLAGTPAEGALTEEELARYNFARLATRQHKETFAKPGSPVSTALNPKEFGSSSESNTANLFIKPNTSAGAPEAWDAYLKAIGNDPQGMQAARDAFAKKFSDAISGVPDAQGNVTIKPAAVAKFVEKYDHIIDSPLFTPDQRSLMDRINKAAQMGARTARAGAPGGSDTFAKLSGKSWVDALVGTGAKKVARTVGATAGYATGGPFGAAAGAYGAPKIMETMLAANKDATMKLLTQALYDPELATTLITPATKASASAISVPMQARIFGILLGRQKANDNAARKVSP